MAKLKLGIIGFGKMGEALAIGVQKKNPEIEIRGTTRSQESAEKIKKDLKVPCSIDNKKLVEWADICLLAVKPHQVDNILNEVRQHHSSKKLWISICASITTDQIQKALGSEASVIRAMPNTPCLIGEGISVLCGGSHCRPEDLKLAEKLFHSVGRTAIVEESLMDGVTGLSGCGPAYIYLIIESLAEAGVKVGLKRDIATLLAAQTLMGSAKMVLERGEHPAALKDEVTTPAGCTLDGLMALEEGKLRVTLIKGVLAATRRSQKLREG